MQAMPSHGSTADALSSALTARWAFTRFGDWNSTNCLSTDGMFCAIVKPRSVNAVFTFSMIVASEMLTVPL